MKIICAWCGLILRNGIGMVSHGICIKCQKTLMEARNEKQTTHQ